MTEQNARERADLLALKESLERKLLAEIADLTQSLERERIANMALQESERILHATVTDLRRVCDDTKQKAKEERDLLLDKFQRNEALTVQICMGTEYT